MSGLQEEIDKKKRKQPSGESDSPRAPNIRFKQLLNFNLVVETVAPDEKFERLKAISKQGLSEIIASLPVQLNSQKSDLMHLVDVIFMADQTNLQDLLEIFEDLEKLLDKQAQHLQEKLENFKINWVYETNQQITKSTLSAEITAQHELLIKSFFYLDQWINFLNFCGYAAAEKYVNGLRIVGEAISVFSERLHKLQETTSQLSLTTRHPKDIIEEDEKKSSFQLKHSGSGAGSFFQARTPSPDLALQNALRESLAANSLSNPQRSSSSSSSSSRPSEEAVNPLTSPESKIISNESDEDDDADDALERAIRLSLGLPISSGQSNSNSRAPADPPSSRPAWMDSIERQEYSKLLEYIINLKPEEAVPTFYGKSVLYFLLESLQELSESQIADSEESLLNIINALTGKFGGILYEDGIGELVDVIEGLTEALHDALNQKQFTP